MLAAALFGRQTNLKLKTFGAANLGLTTLSMTAKKVPHKCNTNCYNIVIVLVSQWLSVIVLNDIMMYAVT